MMLMMGIGTKKLKRWWFVLFQYFNFNITFEHELIRKREKTYQSVHVIVAWLFEHVQFVVHLFVDLLYHVLYAAGVLQEVLVLRVVLVGGGHLVLTE